MIDPVLSLKDVHLALDGNAGRVEILHGISLDVAKGASIGLIGPSGSGKSSLLMLMGGLERATGGSVGSRGGRTGLRRLGGVRGSLMLMPPAPPRRSTDRGRS